MSAVFTNRRSRFTDYLSRAKQVRIEPTRVGSFVFAPALPGVRYPCPCCGYPTLSERGGYDICWVCNWEDDGQDDLTAHEVWGGPNGLYSLSEARKNYERREATGEPYITKDWETRTAQHARGEIFEIFKLMLKEDDAARLDQMWKRVLDAEVIIAREAKKWLGYKRRRK